MLDQNCKISPLYTWTNSALNDRVSHVARPETIDFKPCHGIPSISDLIALFILKSLVPFSTRRSSAKISPPYTWTNFPFDDRTSHRSRSHRSDSARRIFSFQRFATEFQVSRALFRGRVECRIRDGSPYYVRSSVCLSVRNSMCKPRCNHRTGGTMLLRRKPDVEYRGSQALATILPASGIRLDCPSTDTPLVITKRIATYQRLLWFRASLCSTRSSTRSAISCASANRNVRSSIARWIVKHFESRRIRAPAVCSLDFYAELNF